MPLAARHAPAARRGGGGGKVVAVEGGRPRRCRRRTAGPRPIADAARGRCWTPAIGTTTSARRCGWPSTIPAWCGSGSTGVFDDGLYRRAAAALGREASLAAALQTSDDEVAELLRQVATEQADAEPEEVFLRLAREAAVRQSRMVKQAPGGSFEPRSGAAAEVLGRWHGTLVDSTVPRTSDCRQESTC